MLYSLGNKFLLLRYQVFVVYLEIQHVSGPLVFVEELCTSVSGCSSVIYLFQVGKSWIQFSHYYMVFRGFENHRVGL